MKLIVNADDFGMDENVSRAVSECFDRKWITQTTLMVNMPWCEQAVALAREKGFSNRVGLHVNLSEGTPLTPEIRQSRYFCDEHGDFNNMIRVTPRARFWLPPFERQAVRKEITAQMKKFLDLGLPMRHYDSHGHVGAYLSILLTALSCAKSCGFKTTRNWINLSGSHRDIPIALPKRTYSRVVSGVVGMMGLKHPDYLGWAWDMKRVTKSECMDVVVEVLCHPMYALDDPDLEKNEYVKKVDEGGVLIDTLHRAETTIGRLVDLDVQRVTYSDL